MLELRCNSVNDRYGTVVPRQLLTLRHRACRGWTSLCRSTELSSRSMYHGYAGNGKDGLVGSLYDVRGNRAGGPFPQVILLAKRSPFLGRGLSQCMTTPGTCDI